MPIRKGKASATAAVITRSAAGAGSRRGIRTKKAAARHVMTRSEILKTTTGQDASLALLHGDGGVLSSHVSLVLGVP
jgi:hypothetical protein